MSSERARVPGRAIPLVVWPGATPAKSTDLLSAASSACRTRALPFAFAPRPHRPRGPLGVFCQRHHLLHGGVDISRLAAHGGQSLRCFGFAEIEANSAAKVGAR